MSWIDKELKKRTGTGSPEPAASQPAGGKPRSAVTMCAALWDRLESVNRKLPAPLQLRRDLHEPGSFVNNQPAFPVMLTAENGAWLGFAFEDGIRYEWPQKQVRKSHNFWIRWDQAKGFVVSRRVGASWVNPVHEEHRFDVASIEHIVKCLVQGQRIKSSSLRKGRFLFIFPRR